MIARLSILAAIGLALLPAQAAAAGLAGWQKAADLPAARQYATATKLLDGTVLVAGGLPGDGRSAYLYDPDGDAWKPVGSLEQGRYGHTATRLDDGRVLIAGGNAAATGGTALQSAEIYDPKTQQFSGAGQMTVPRAYAAATLLPDKRVLVVAGTTSGATDLYTPGGPTPGWSRAAPLNPARQFVAAALDGQGQVLVAGGRVGSSVATTGVRYDPEKNEWSGVPGEIPGRARATATTLLDGRVLVAGGTSDVNDRGVVSSAYVYTPGGAWTAVGGLGQARFGQTATRLADGRVLLAGGVGQSGPANVPLDSAELYDPARLEFAPTGKLRVPRENHVAAELDDGSALVAGGDDFPAIHSTVDRWFPSTTLDAPASLAFGDQADGSTGPQTALHVKNTGSQPLRIANPALSGPNATDFAISANGCATAVAPGDECLIRLRFTPHAAGARSATLSFDDNTDAAGHSVTLGGRGTPVVAFALSPTTSSGRAGTSHTVTATVSADGAAVPAGTVAFTVTGPNGAPAANRTINGGQATLSYTGANAGTDSISATYTDSVGISHAATGVTRTWTDVAALVTLAPGTGSANVGETQSVTATLTEDGLPVPARGVTFTVTDGPHAGRSAVVTAGGDGTATFAYVGASGGVDSIVASFVDSLGRTVTSGAVQRTWTVRPPDVRDRDADGVADDQDNCPDAANAGQADADGDRVGDACEQLPSGNKPVVVGEVAKVEVISGEVFVKLPPGAHAAQAGTAPIGGYVPLKGIATVPVGSIIDARAGALKLTTAASFKGRSQQTARLSAALFAVRQAKFAKRTQAAKGVVRRKTPKPTTDLVLKTPPGLERACSSAATVTSIKGVVRTLTGVGKGRYRTYGAASTTSTTGNATWVVSDRCDGTRTEVGRGKATVHDLKLHKDRVVRAGQGYTARARLFAAKQRGR